MARASRVGHSSFLIVGAGAAGTITATRLLDEANRREQPIEVLLVDPQPSTGRGVAFSTHSDHHLLNVPARKMSAYTDEPQHFVDWLDANGHDADPCGFAPRKHYGAYLEATLEAAANRTPWAHLRRLHAQVLDLKAVGLRCRATLADGQVFDADAAVLALGHLGLETGWAPAAIRGSAAFVADPWKPGALDAIPLDADVLLVGTGLTMVDCAVGLLREGRVVHAVSRHGLLPHRHTSGNLPVMEAPDFAGIRPDLARLRATVRGHLVKAAERYGDWRPGLDSVRGITQALWAGLCDADREEFLLTDARAWDAARHRIPPASADVIEGALADGRLVVHVGEVGDAVLDEGTALVDLTDQTRLRVAAVVNCTGPCDRPARSNDGFVHALMDRGLAQPGPFGIGFDTDPSGRVTGAGGTSNLPIWTLGSLRKGSLWESTAIPEIRDQAAALAGELLAATPRRTRQPHDQYGLPLSTTTEAAQAWRRGLDAVRTVQAGAHEALLEAVDADPGFAMAHAALALLGHEWDLPVDVMASLRLATETAGVRATSRERSFVHLVEARILAPREAGDRQLRRHVAEHPLDAFAVSIALPTIAFGGLVQPVQDTWALVDRLAPIYADDWWFAGINAFFLQEQEKWDRAGTLAQRSMAEEPASGHAAHALTHVFYETGSHVAGLEWLDGWIAAHGPTTSYRAHYSWHAALHELALDDPAAMRARYAAQLAPPVVTGARALVDSASLLWRSRVGGCWDEALPIEAVLATVAECYLDRPATAFTALHAALCLGAAGDIDRLAGLRRFASNHDECVFPEVVVPLCDGIAAVVAGAPEAAVAPLSQIVGQLPRLGGSAAQQEVVTETLLHALVASGETARARTLIQDRLDRRPNPSESRRLANLPTP